MDTSSSTAASATPRAKRITVRAAIVLVAIGALWFLLVGRGGLVLFSPYTLECVSQSERTILFGEYPIYRSPREANRNELIDYLVDRGLVEPVEPVQQRWELVYHWNNSWRGGDGRIYNILERNRHSLIRWSEAHPEQAKVFWREFFKSLRSEYEFENEIAFSIANRYRSCKSLDELRYAIFEIRCWEVFLMSARIQQGHPSSDAEREYVSQEIERLKRDPLMKTFLRKQAKRKARGPMASEARPLVHPST